MQFAITILGLHFVWDQFIFRLNLKGIEWSIFRNPHEMRTTFGNIKPSTDGSINWTFNDLSGLAWERSELVPRPLDTRRWKRVGRLIRLLDSIKLWFRLSSHRLLNVEWLWDALRQCIFFVFSTIEWHSRWHSKIFFASTFLLNVGEVSRDFLR